ncbi:hypothetical protein NQZ68_025702 [Dissostichus eleginoides]|nr:hypothetical protein NQZ68_025702 [Dissostichus eleginoides]
MVRSTGPVTPVSSQIQEEGVFSSDSWDSAELSHSTQSYHLGDTESKHPSPPTNSSLQEVSQLP